MSFLTCLGIIFRKVSDAQFLWIICNESMHFHCNILNNLFLMIHLKSFVPMWFHTTFLSETAVTRHHGSRGEIVTNPFGDYSF
jgi:hypothetical protein